MTKLEIYSERHGLHRNTDKYMNTPIFFSLERLPGALGIQLSLPSREYDASNVMEAPESLLGVHAPFDGGLEVPKAGLGITLGDAAGLLEDLADGILGGNMTSLGRLGVPLQRFLVALLDAASQLAAEGVFGHPLGMPALGGLEEVLGGRLDVNIDVVVTILIDGSELVGGIEVRACRVGQQKADADAAVEAAESALAKAFDVNVAAAKPILHSLHVLEESDLDGTLDIDTMKLMQCYVLMDGTPQSLGEFANRGPDQAALLDKMLSDTNLLRQVVLASGAKGGKYGPAMQSYNDILKQSSDVAKHVIL